MPLISCGRCHECARGQGHLCRTMACTGLSSDWGGLADLAIVSARQVVPVAGRVTAQQAALIEPTAVAAYGVDRGRLQPGQTVLITGAGPIGSLAAIYALAAGARTVVVSEPDPSRRERASRLGEGLGEVVVADPAAEDVSDFQILQHLARHRRRDTNHRCHPQDRRDPVHARDAHQHHEDCGNDQCSQRQSGDGIVRRA